MKLLKKFKAMSKTKKVITTVIATPVILFLAIVISVIVDDSTSVETANANIIENEYSIRYGELLDVIVTEDIMVLKAKIESNLTNKMTIQQNAHNVEEFILKNDMEGIKELQYWAVADMTNGEESKVISFTLNENMINSVKNKTLFAIDLIDNAKDVWIHPSLSN